MSYDKLSLASFKEALKANKYVNATGARRAVGKATTLSDADKEKARAAIDEHFGLAPASPKKTAAKKTAAAPKKAAAAKVPAAPKKKKKKKSSAKKAASARIAAPVAEAQAVGVIPQIGPIDLENIDSVATQMKIAEKTIQNVGAALSVLSQAKQQYPEADLGSAVEEMGGTLAGAVGIFRQVVNNITKTIGSAESVSQAPIQGVVNHGVVPSRAESLFKGSVPGAASAEAIG
jgi:hypothetical protein